MSVKTDQSYFLTYKLVCTIEQEDKKMSTTTNMLQSHVDSIAEELRRVYDGEVIADEGDALSYGIDEGEPLSFWDYFNDALDIEYTIGSDMSFRGVRVMVTCGGPNIYVDTVRGEVFGAWWGDTASAWIPSEICDEINTVFEELYECSR